MPASVPVGADSPAPAQPAVRGTAPALILRADRFAVRDALAIVVDVLRSDQLTEEELGAVELVLAEVLNNVVEHAYRGAEGEEIQLWWTLGRTGLHVRVADRGAEMPGDCPPLFNACDPADHAMNVPEGGFGWFLISGLARNIVYRRERGMNVLTFRIVVGPPLRARKPGTTPFV